MSDNTSQSITRDKFDYMIGALHGLPDVVASAPTTIRTTVPIVGASVTFIIQTYRQRDSGDTIFVECVSGEGSLRLAIPPKVADAIARQRDAVTTKARRKAARQTAQDRKDRGELPGFMRNKVRAVSE